MAEAHDLRGIMSLMAEGFIAGPGQHSKQESKRILFVMLRRYGDFRLLYPKPTVKLSEDEQSAVVKMNFLIATKGRLFPELDLLYADPSAWLEAVGKGADIYTLSMQLNHEAGDWLLDRARLTSFTRPHGRM